MYWLWLEQRKTCWDLHYPYSDQLDCESGNFRSILPHTTTNKRNFLWSAHSYFDANFQDLIHTDHFELYRDILSILSLVCQEHNESVKLCKFM